MTTASKVKEQRVKRKARIRKKVAGSSERPRLSVFRSANHVYAQVIDDDTGMTLASSHSYKKGSKTRANIETCTGLGKKLAAICLAKNIKTVVFDKNGYAYHGRVKAVADGAREGGLIF
jgi:large subunit ribosomal protein L18